MKYLSLVLALGVLLLSTMPCCFEDKCLSAFAETIDSDNDVCNTPNNCSDDSCCSPFLHCNTCFGFPEAQYSKPLRTTTNLISCCESEYIIRNNLPDFISSIWQPP